MGVKARVRMKLCTRKAGEIRCVDDGFEATYEEKTVGPTDVKIRYPTS